MTVQALIQESVPLLTQKGIDSPRLQIEEIVAHALGLPRMQLYLDLQRRLTPDQLESCRAMLQQRLRRIPLQHLLGSVSFCGLEINVTRDALIPRPETEILVEQVEAVVQSLKTPNRTVLDFGTGSGCIAVALAVRNPELRLTAVDVAPEALALAQRNARRHGVHDRFTWIQAQGLSSLDDRTRFDVIVSNPPYIPSAEINDLQPEVRDHDPRMALDGGPDGLACYRQLATEAIRLLPPGGTLAVEFGDGQADAIAALLHTQNWIVGTPVPDYSGRERCLIARRPL